MTSLLSRAATLAIAASILLPPTFTLGQSPIGSEARARELIHALSLTVLPKESGYLGLVGTSAQTALNDGRKLAVQSQVYYMLTAELPINYLHWLASDDTHILIEGGPVDYFIFHPDGKVEMRTLGMDLAHGERPIVAATKLFACTRERSMR